MAIEQKPSVFQGAKTAPGRPRGMQRMLAATTGIPIALLLALIGRGSTSLAAEAPSTDRSDLCGLLAISQADLKRAWNRRFGKMKKRAHVLTK